MVGCAEDSSLRAKAPTESTVTMASPWDEMIEAFRALGGVADNVVLGNGKLGRGLFPIDRNAPVRLRVPESLLISDSCVRFVDGQFKILDSAEIGQPEREFLEAYQNTFSWGGGGRSGCAAFVQEFDRLPPEIAAWLAGGSQIEGDRTSHASSYRDMENPAEAGRDRVGQNFLHSRVLERSDGKGVLMPVLDLVNHGLPAQTFGKYGAGGVSLEGMFADEVLVMYRRTDALGIFRDYGFASREQMAFSLGFTRNEPNKKLIIDRHTNRTSRRGPFDIPNVRIDGHTIHLSHLMIGNMKFPRLSKGIFCSVTREAGWPDPEEQFDLILHNNRMKFLKLLEILEPHEGGLIPTIRKMARYQLEAMSYCIGTREL